MASPAAPQDALKIVVLGSISAGKSCLLTRFANDSFTDSLTYGPAPTTVAGAFFSKSVMVGATKLRLHLWDTAGSEAYHSITRMYYRNAGACILCYDITKYKSFTEVHRWHSELARNEPDCRVYVCGCKLDLQRDQRQVNVAEARQFAEARGATFFETSARTGENVVPMFNKICGDSVNWANILSITTGEEKQQQQSAPAHRLHGNRGNGSKSFALTAPPGADSRSGNRMKDPGHQSSGRPTTSSCCNTA